MYDKNVPIIIILTKIKEKTDTATSASFSEVYIEFDIIGHVVWLQMRQLSTRDQMTQKLTTIGHRTTFNNEQSPYRIVRYKRPRNDKCKTIQTRKLTF